MSLKIFLRGRDEAGERTNDLREITAVCSGIALSGDVQSCARKLTMNVLRKDLDYYLGYIGGLGRGDALFLRDGDREIYRGIIWETSEEDTSVLKSVTAYDNLKFLLKSKSVKSTWNNMTAAEITEEIGKDLGVTPGEMAQTDIKLSINARDKTGYEAMMAAWTETRRQNLKYYYPTMVEGKLRVIEKGELLSGKKLIYQSEPLPCSLISVSRVESSEEAITALVTLNDNGGQEDFEMDKELVKLYGYILATKEKGPQSSLDGVPEINSGTVTCECEAVGDWQVQTGFSILMDCKLFTAKFYIQADSHQYDNGVHTMHLTLSYENSMDEKESDAAENTSVVWEEVITGTPEEFNCIGYCGCVICRGNMQSSANLMDGTCRNLHTAAAPETYKLGTKLYIPHFRNQENGGNFVIEDRLEGLKGKELALFFYDHEEAVLFGKRQLQVYVGGERKIKKIIQKTSSGVRGGGSVQARIWSFLRENGFSAAATAGIMGNMQQESGFKVTVEEYSGGGGYGLCQWTGGRRTLLMNWCQANGKQYNSLEGQLAFLMYEIGGGDATTAALLNQKCGGLEGYMQLGDVAQATRIFQEAFERAGDPYLARRIKYAQGFYDKWKDYVTVPGADGDGEATGDWGWPLENGAGTVTCRFGVPTGTGPHRGVDISSVAGNGPGSNVVASDGGTVIAAGHGVEDATYGNSVCIDHGNGWFTRYAHLYSLAVTAGMAVSKGQIIGVEGNTGTYTFGTHLHFEMLQGGKWGNLVDPLGYIGR